jgi:hypothetical protein
MMTSIVDPSQAPGLFDEGTPTSLPLLLDGSTIPAGISLRVGLSNDTPTRLPLRFFLQKPPGSAATVAAWFDAKCDEFSRERNQPVYGIYPAIVTIAHQVGLAESTVGETALKWLLKKGWLEAQQFLVGGTIRTMFWCKWRMPASASPEVALPGQAPRNSERQAPRNSGTKVKSELIQEEKTTTDGGMLSFFQEGDSNPGRKIQEPDLESMPITELVEAPAHSGPIPVPSDVPSVPLPEPIVRAIEAVETVEDRPLLRAAALDWTAKFGVEAVILAIVVLRAKRRNDEKITTLSGFMAGVLANGPGGKDVKAEAKRLEAEKRREDQAKADRLAAEAKRAKLAAELAEASDSGQNLYDALSKADREELWREYEKVEHSPASPALAVTWKLRRLDWCLQTLKARNMARNEVIL